MTERRPGDISHDRAQELQDEARTIRATTFGTRSSGRRTLRRPRYSHEADQHSLHYGQAQTGQSNGWIRALYVIFAVVLLIGAVLGTAGLLIGEPAYQDTLRTGPADCEAREFGTLHGSFDIELDTLDPTLAAYGREHDLAVTWLVRMPGFPDPVPISQRWAFPEDGILSGQIQPESTMREVGRVDCSIRVLVIDDGSWNTLLRSR